MRTCRFYQANAFSDLALCRGVQHRKYTTLLWAICEAGSTEEQWIRLTLILKPHNSSSPHMSLVPPALPLLHQRPSKCLQVIESLCMPFREASGFPATFCLKGMHRGDHHWFSLPGVETPHSDTGPLDREPSVRLGSLPLVGTSATKVTFPMFNHYLLVWGQPVSCLCPSYQTQSGFFFISLVTEFLFS